MTQVTPGRDVGVREATREGRSTPRHRAATARPEGSSRPPGLHSVLIGVVTLALLISGSRLRAQISGELAAPRPSGTPGWMSAWSPLAPLGDLSLERPVSEPLLPGVLSDPAPRVGAFWTAGNPGAIAVDVESSYTRAGSGYEEASGDQRRPLDPGRAIQRGLRGRAWGPLGESGAGVGHVSVLRSRYSGGAASSVPEPYTSSPLVLGDSLGHTLGTTTALVEGAGGWALGNVAFGLALGFRGEESRTVASPVPRVVRTSVPGLTAGVTWQPGEDAPRVGGYARWRRGVRAVQVVARTAPDRIYEFVGFDEPLTSGVGPGGGSFFSRRVESGARAVGASISGRDLGLRWVAWGQTETLTDDRFQDLTQEPSRETWEADGASGGLGLETAVGGSLRASLVGRYRTVSGDLFRPRFDDPTYGAESSRWRWTGRLRRVTDGAWEGGLSLHLVRDARTRSDRVARVGSDLVTWEYGAGLTVGRRITGGLRVSVGGGLVRYVPTTVQVPNPAAMDELYVQWIAPELAVHATEATVRAGAATLSLDVGSGTRLWLRAADAELSPGDAGLPGALQGDRGSFRVELGVRTGGR